MNEVCVLLNDDIFLITVVVACVNFLLLKKFLVGVMNREREKERNFTSFLSLGSFF